MRRAMLTVMLVSLSAPALGAQQYVLSAEPRVVISGEVDPSAQFTTLLGIARFASGEIALGTYDPVGINLYSGDGSLIRKLAAPGEGPGEMRMPQFFGRRGDSLVTFDLGLRRMNYYTTAGARRQSRARLPAVRRHVPTVVGVLPNGGLLVIQVPYRHPPSPDGPTRDREALMIVPADTSQPPVTVGDFAGYGLVYRTEPGAAEASFLMDALNAGTSWMVVGNEVAVADPASPAVLMFTAAGTPTRTIVLPIPPRPFNAKAVREARDRMAPILLGGRSAQSPARTARKTAHFELMFNLAKRPKSAPYFRRLVRATNDGMWAELYREHIGMPSVYLRIDAAGRVSGRLNGPAHVEFHEFGADYALGVREDPETDVKSVVLYMLLRERGR